MKHFEALSLVSLGIVAIFLLGIAVGALKADMWHQDRAIMSLSWNTQTPEAMQEKKDAVTQARFTYWTETESPLTLLATSSVSIRKERVVNPMTYAEMAARSSVTGTTCAVFDETRMRDNAKALTPFAALAYTLTAAPYRGQSEPLRFVITLVPNTPEYASLSEVERDFGLCDAGGNTYPARLSPEKKWIVLRSSCGSAGAVESDAERIAFTAFCDGYVKEAMESLIFHE
jgi:hypothetical protein